MQDDDYLLVKEDDYLLVQENYYPIACGISATVPPTRRHHRKLSQNRPKIVPKSSPNPQKLQFGSHFGTLGVKNRTSAAGSANSGPEGRKSKRKGHLGIGLLGTGGGTFGRHCLHLAEIFCVFGCKVGGPLDDRRFDSHSVRKWTAGCS